jgi:hypothetical protein
MKPSYFAYLLILVLLVELTIQNNLKVNEKNTVNTSAQTDQSIYSKMWNDLFSVPRGKACSSTKLKARVRRELVEEGIYPGQRIKKKKFWWIKQWGYEAAAYFFDYLDPVLREPVVKEFQSIFKDVSAFPKEDSNIPDPFDYKKIIQKNSAYLTKRQINQIKLFTKNFDPDIYNISVNLPQIHAAINKWKWNINPGDASVYRRFIMSYDLNFDGRLNPREMILATIWNNQQTVGSPICDHCFFELAKTFDAIFLYMDCDNDGLLSAEEIWKNLPKINRYTEKFNIFSFGNDESIRTSSINDFILKNSKIRDGFITRNEFRIGLLLGFWDRQTEFTKILTDDSRTLKKLRWQEDEMIDIALYNYTKKKMTAGLIK